MERSAVVDRFGAPLRATAFVRTNVAQEDVTYATSRVTFPAYRPAIPKNATSAMTLRVPVSMPRGLVVVLPILGGDYGPSDTFARALAEAGFTTLRFDRRDKIFDPDKDFRHVARTIDAGVVDVRRGLRWAVEQRLAGRGRIGVLGISMGSFVGTIVAATEPRVDAAVLALGGGGLPDILFSAQSEEEIGALFAALRARGLDDAAIHAAAARDLERVDPLRFARALDRDSTLLVHARFDGVVPFSAGQRFRAAMGRPRRFVTLTGHYSAVFVLPSILSAVEAHFTEQLDPDVTDSFEPFH